MSATALALQNMRSPSILWALTIMCNGYCLLLCSSVEALLKASETWLQHRAGQRGNQLGSSRTEDLAERCHGLHSNMRLVPSKPVVATPRVRKQNWPKFMSRRYSWTVHRPRWWLHTRQETDRSHGTVADSSAAAQAYITVGSGVPLPCGLLFQYCQHLVGPFVGRVSCCVRPPWYPHAAVCGRSQSTSAWFC